VTTTKHKAKKAGRAVQANPVTTTSLIGVVVAVIGNRLGWEADTQAAVVTFFLALGPVVRGLVAWWEHRKKTG
jgi:hypothetical protein